MLDLIERLFKKRVSENEGEEAVPAVDDFLSPTRTGPKVRRAVDLAIATSVREVMWTSGARNFDEEHQTASFMGLLTSNLTWHLLMAGVQGQDGDTLQFPEISWAHFGKSAESRKGADFGLLARPLDGSYRLTLFQAKRAKSGKIDAGYIIGKRAILPDTSAYGAMCSYYVNEQEWRDSNPDEFAKLVSVLRELKTPKYQLEAFMATNLLGQPRFYCHIPWCYYAVWGESAGETSAEEPRTIAAEEIMTSVANSGERSPGSFHVPADSTTLTDIVSNVLRGSSDETYIKIGEQDLAKLLAKITALLPDLQLIGIDDEGKGVLSNALGNSGFTVRCQNLELAGQRFEPKIASYTYRRI